MQFKPVALAVIASLFVSACQTIPDRPVKTPQASSKLAAPVSQALCENKAAQIRAGYAGARVSACKAVSDNLLLLTIRPEKATDPQGARINNSPWYGFRVDPKTKDTLKLRLVYEKGTHRYQPKISYDGTHWNWLEANQITTISDDKVELKLPQGAGPFFISAQEVFTAKAHENWIDKISENPHITRSTIGASRDGHPIYMLDVQTEPGRAKPYIVWVGRQHPPEVTGAQALIPFTEKILGGSELSGKFLERFNVMIIPLINPDGVDAGHWRFNKGGTDLNRDWGPFTQPETSAVKSALSRFESGSDKIGLFLDFHSTNRNLLYTQADDEPTSPPMFARDWVKAVKARLGQDIYPFTREARHNSGKPISKNYMYETYGIAAITYEVGDETPRSAIKISAEVFAEEMMKILIHDHDSGRLR